MYGELNLPIMALLRDTHETDYTENNGRRRPKSWKIIIDRQIQIKNRNRSIFLFIYPLFIYLFIFVFLADSTLFLDFQRKVAIDYTAHTEDRKQRNTEYNHPQTPGTIVVLKPVKCDHVRTQ